MSFAFICDPRSLECSDTLTLYVPTAVPGKYELLAWYANALGLPDYFGMNWDALDECLRDLSWIKEPRVILFHSKIPEGLSQQERKVYLDILKDTVGVRGACDTPELVVAFDPAAEPELRDAVTIMLPT